MPKKLTREQIGAKRRQQARDVISRKGRSARVEQQLSEEWGVGRRQVRQIMLVALREMAAGRVRSRENFAALEAVAWEGLTRSVEECDHRATNAYLRTLVHLEVHSQPAEEEDGRPSDSERLTELREVVVKLGVTKARAKPKKKQPQLPLLGDDEP